MSIVMLVAQGRWVTRFLAMSIRFTGPLLDHTHLHDGNSFKQVIPAEAYCPNRRVNHDTIPVTTTNRVLIILLCDQPTSTSLSSRVRAPFSATVPFLGKPLHLYRISQMSINHHWGGRRTPMNHDLDVYRFRGADNLRVVATSTSG